MKCDQTKMHLKRKIPRGIVYHSLTESLSLFFAAIFGKIKSDQIIEQAESQFAEYVEAKYSVAFSFARTGLAAVLEKYDFPTGSEILMPPITIKGMLEIIKFYGLKPVFVDLCENSPNFDQADLERKITVKTVAALITPLFGMAPNMEKVTSAFRSHDIISIVDFSQALNAKFKGKHLHSFCDYGIYSASSLKTVDTCGGGFVVSASGKGFAEFKRFQASLSPPSRWLLVRRTFLNLVRNLATSRVIFSLLTFWYLRLLATISPDEALKQTGKRSGKLSNSLPKVWFTKYTSQQAKFLIRSLVSISSTDQKRIETVKQIKSRCYDEKKFFDEVPDTFSVFWQLIYLSKDPYKAQRKFAEVGIDIATSSLSFIPSLLPDGDYKLSNAEYIYRNGVYLPCSLNLSDADISMIATVINKNDD